MVTTCPGCGRTCGSGDGALNPCPYCRGTFDRFPGSDASVFIQWKGTDLCMDFHCECGYHSHIHGMFGYTIECVGCEALYEMGTQVRARRMSDEEAKRWRDRDLAILRDGDE